MGVLFFVILGVVFFERCEGWNGLVVVMYEGIGIMSIVMIMILLVVFSDYLKESYFYSLQFKINRECKVKIICGGIVLDFFVLEVVVGDLCLLNKGIFILVDGVVVQENDFFVNELILIGEKSMVFKVIDFLVFVGIYVVNGSGKMIVLVVGFNIQIYKSNNQFVILFIVIIFKVVFFNEVVLNINLVFFDYKEDNVMF